MRLFLPYQPLRDNIPLAKLCGEVNGDTDSEQCVSQLWDVRIAGREVPIDDFVVAERMDIGIRGLPGLVPLSGLQPGMHVIKVIWNPDPDNTAELPDDRYTQVTSEFNIPIAFSPEYERALQ